MYKYSPRKSHEYLTSPVGKLTIVSAGAVTQNARYSLSGKILMRAISSTTFQ
jgi:hypothetical protein